MSSGCEILGLLDVGTELVVGWQRKESPAMALIGRFLLLLSLASVAAAFSGITMHFAAYAAGSATR